MSTLKSVSLATSIPLRLRHRLANEHWCIVLSRLIYLCLPCDIKVLLELLVQLLHLTALFHPVDNIVCVFLSLLSTPIFSFDDFLGASVTVVFQPMKNVLVQMIAPME